MKWAAATLSLLSGCMANVSSVEAKQLVNEGALLVDVRSHEEYNEGHLPGAVLIPVGKIEDSIDQLGSKERPIVVYCHTGVRAAMASRKLKKAGFRQVHNLGGMSRWPGDERERGN